MRSGCWHLIQNSHVENAKNREFRPEKGKVYLSSQLSVSEMTEDSKPSLDQVDK